MFYKLAVITHTRPDPYLAATAKSFFNITFSLVLQKVIED